MSASPRRVVTRLAGLGVYLPETIRRTVDTEKRLRSDNPHVRLATGLIKRMTGVHTVHVRPDGWEASDLAVAAARVALAESPGDVDLLLFASASQDLVEPATSHIVAAKLGLDVPVMDIKNACNSVINAMQVADALIRSGQYRRVLIASGEGPSVAVRWNLRDHDEFIRSFPGYTMSDGGAALILEADDAAEGESGILATRFVAASRHWNVGTLPGGGTMRPHDPDAAYFDMDGRALQQAFLELGPQPVLDLLADNGWTWDDFDLVAIHQVALPYLPPIFERLGVPDDRTVLTIAEHGNLASVTLPLQLQVARERGMVGPGSRVLLIGLAGGISLGLVAVRL
ncbi:MAG: 3-oxoacyl-[acyl-carrier-protein] synthase III C-terminal domain-containing protein [Pseudolysinimonas sp.]